jgi:hypothetical protein
MFELSTKMSLTLVEFGCSFQLGIEAWSASVFSPSCRRKSRV